MHCEEAAHKIRGPKLNLDSRTWGFPDLDMGLFVLFYWRQHFCIALAALEHTM